MFDGVIFGFIFILFYVSVSLPKASKIIHDIVHSDTVSLFVQLTRHIIHLARSMLLQYLRRKWSTSIPKPLLAPVDSLDIRHHEHFHHTNQKSYLHMIS